MSLESGFAGPNPSALFKPEGLAYIESDHLNTPRAIIDPTRNVAVWRWDLAGDAFGAHAANDDADGDGIRYQMNLRYPGQYFDTETGLHYNYFRDYEPQTGRYVESDPVGLEGGAATYSYAKLNPLIFFDPDGLRARVCCKSIRAIGWLGIKHCYIERDSDGRMTWGLFGNTRGPASTMGDISINDPFDKKGDCGPWNEDCDVDECVENAANNYSNPSVYRFVRGPNSNTFAGSVARKCKLSNSGIGGLTPGYDDLPALPAGE